MEYRIKTWFDSQDSVSHDYLEIGPNGKESKTPTTMAGKHFLIVADEIIRKLPRNARLEIKIKD